MNISVVTTFHKSGYEKYGKRMIEGFIKNWPATVKLYVYAEDVDVTEQASNVIIKDLHTSSPDLVAFKNKWKAVPYANGDVSSFPRLAARKDSHKPFKWDAVRFSHKVYAIFDCAKICNGDVLFWMDADTICHSPITQQRIEELCADADLGFLGRENKYTECGLYSMNLKSPIIQDFLKEFQRMYDNAETGIFTLDEWHDSFVFDAVRKKFTGHLKELNWSSGIIKGEGHPLINCEWGAYLDHLKGDRKDAGRSKDNDLKIKRTEEYWR